MIPMAALAAALVLLLCACGRPSQPGGPTTAADLAPASKKAAVSPWDGIDPDDPFADPTADGPTTAQATTQAQQQTTTLAQTSTTALPATTVYVVTAAQIAAGSQAEATTRAVTMPPDPPPPFVNTKIVQGGPGRWIDESLHKSPHTVYAIDFGSVRFAFQPRPYSPGGAFVLDVYRDNLDGTYAPREALDSGVNNAGRYSIVLVGPDSTIGKDNQGRIFISNVYRFEYSEVDTRYSVFLLGTHETHELTAYYRFDPATLRFNKFAP